MSTKAARKVARAVSDREYEMLASFRHALRRFLSFSEEAARVVGLTPQQHQALLAIKGFQGKGVAGKGFTGKSVAAGKGVADKSIADKSITDKSAAGRSVQTRGEVTIGELAEALQIKHHSAVGLVDRLVDQGLATRVQAEGDRRQVLVSLTPHGLDLLAELTSTHRRELQRVGPELRTLLTRLSEDDQP
jgi:DNA-binding MarR family transcriptional regulator